MDDLNNAFGGPRVRTSVEEQWHAEMRRKQYDIIRVKNPRSCIVKGVSYELPAQDFYQEYDTNQFQKIVFDTQIDIPRYIAIRYVEHMKDQIVHFVDQKLHDDYIMDRDKKGLPRYADKATENKETYETEAYPKTNDEKVINEIYDQLWIGLVHEFGRDVPPENINPRMGNVDMTPISMRAIESLDKRRVATSDRPQYQSVPNDAITVQSPPPLSTASPFSQMNEKLDAKEITVE